MIPKDKNKGVKLITKNNEIYQEGRWENIVPIERNKLNQKKSHETLRARSNKF